MKMIKRHTLAVAVCLACGVTGAQAAISNGLMTAQSLGSNQDGELYLNVWDQLAQTSYAIDLGTTVTGMVAGQNTNHVWNLDQTFINWAALTTDTLTFNVAGTNTYLPKSDTNYSTMLSTRTGYDNKMKVNMGVNIIQIANNVAARAIALNALNGPNGRDGDQYNYAENLSSVTTPSSGQPYFDYATWGAKEGITSFVGSATVRNGGTDQTVDLAFIHSPGGTIVPSTQAKVDYLNGYLALDVANATLNWHTNAVAAVPLPGAAWMFMSALLTALGFQKRKRRSLAA